MLRPEDSIVIRTEGLTRRETDSLKIELQAVAGVSGVRERNRPLDAGLGLEIQASASTTVHLIVGFAAAQVLPGLTEFTKAIGKKSGDAVGDLVADWFRREFSGQGNAEASVTIFGPEGQPIRRLRGREGL